MTDAPKLHHYRFAYELEDGTAGTVTVHNRSLIAWDETRALRKWPDSGEAPNLWQTFLVHHALSRRGEYKEDFAKFKDDCLALDMLNADGEPITAKALEEAGFPESGAGEEYEGEPSHPTRPVAVPDSPLP